VSKTAFNSYTTEWLVGKRITISYTNTSENSWIDGLSIFAGGDGYTEGNFVKIKDQADDINGISSHSFTITNEIAEKLLSGGLYVLATPATLDSITILPSEI